MIKYIILSNIIFTAIQSSPLPTDKISSKIILSEKLQSELHITASKAHTTDRLIACLPPKTGSRTAFNFLKKYCDSEGYSFEEGSSKAHYVCSKPGTGQTYKWIINTLTPTYPLAPDPPRRGGWAHKNRNSEF